jgi:hypothetical protein
MHVKNPARCGNDWMGSWRPTPELTVGMALYQFMRICKSKSAHEVKKWRIPLYCFLLRDRIAGKDTTILHAPLETGGEFGHPANGAERLRNIIGYSYQSFRHFRK